MLKSYKTIKPFPVVRMACTFISSDQLVSSLLLNDIGAPAATHSSTTRTAPSRKISSRASFSDTRAYFFFLVGRGGLTSASPSRTVTPSWFSHTVFRRTFLSPMISTTSTEAVTVSPNLTGALKLRVCCR